MRQGKVKVVDGTWFMPAEKKNAYENYKNARIPGAVHFDIDAVCDLTTTLPHMFPTPEFFAEKVGAMGIKETDTIVIYDQLGLFSAARVWHTFKVFGAKNVSILDGGFPAWQHQALPIDSGEPTEEKKERNFIPALQRDKFKTVDQMVTNTATAQSSGGKGGTVVVDARSSGRFSGKDPEPRPGLSSGHIPHSINLPFGELLTKDPVTGATHLKNKEALLKVFQQVGVPTTDTKVPIITTCGSGVTASVIALALHECGYSNVAVYDGSWTEWASTAGTSIEKIQ